MGQYNAELTMSRLVSKQPHSRAWCCYGKMFLDVFFKDCIIHSVVLSTVPVHFPV